MPKSSAAMEVVQDSEDDQPKSSKKQNVKDAENQDGDEAADKSAAENGDEDEEEYEIEAILEAKHGTFPGVRSSSRRVEILDTHVLVLRHVSTGPCGLSSQVEGVR